MLSMSSLWRGGGGDEEEEDLEEGNGRAAVRERESALVAAMIRSVIITNTGLVKSSMKVFSSNPHNA